MFRKSASLFAVILSTLSTAGAVQADEGHGRHQRQPEPRRVERVERNYGRYEQNRRTEYVRRPQRTYRSFWFPPSFGWYVAPPPVVVRPSYTYVPPAPPPVYTTPAPVYTAPTALTSSIAYGRPEALDGYGANGYFVWLGQNGIWHLRGASAGVTARFSGSISSSAGQIDLVSSTMDRVTEDGNRIAFEADCEGANNGIDFRLPPGASLRFDLRQNGAAPAIFLGRGQTPAPGGSFVIYQ